MPEFFQIIGMWIGLPVLALLAAFAVFVIVTWIKTVVVNEDCPRD